MRLVLDNHVPLATITYTSQVAAYPADNVKSYDLDLPWKPNDATPFLIIDHGSAKTVGMWAILGTNFATMRIEANATNVWTAPSYTSGTLTLGVNLGNGRLCRRVIPPAAQTLRYNRIVIPSQATVPPGETFFRIGAVIAGPLVVPPRDFRWAPEVGEVEPISDVFTVSKRRQRSLLGPSLFRMSGQLQAVGSITGTRDMMKEWMALERAWKAKDAALISFSNSDDAWVSVMRSLEPITWTVDLPAERSFEWEEVG